MTVAKAERASRSSFEETIHNLTGPRAPVRVARVDAPPLTPQHWLKDPAYLGHGWITDVWGDDEWVVKIGRETVSEANLMPQRDDPKRQALAEHTLRVIERLRASIDFEEF